jgi:hypothetical protein
MQQKVQEVEMKEKRDSREGAKEIREKQETRSRGEIQGPSLGRAVKRPRPVRMYCR